MNPSCYVDLQLADGSASAPGGNKIFALLHGAFTTLSDHQYALAIPGLYLPKQRQPKRGTDMRFSKLRVFAETMVALQALNDAITADNIQFLFPKTIPDGFDGDWGVFSRFRVPSRKAERTPDNPLRLRKIMEATERDLLYFSVYSKTTDQFFRLHIDFKRVEPSVVESSTPDAYGLSVKSRLIPLPLLP